MRRKSLPLEIERQVYYESMGYCMNPECNLNFFKNNCGEKAHIQSIAAGGHNSIENLIHLCANCHTKFDKNPSCWTPDELRGWKEERKIKREEQFIEYFPTFKDLKNKVVPILKRNQGIFQSYGPHDQKPEKHNLWKKFEPEIIANNRKLELFLDKNRNLLHQSNQKIIDNFIKHSKEFVKTRKDDIVTRQNLFPEELSSIFGLTKVDNQIIIDVSALQNFISDLQKQNKYQDLNLLSKPPVLKYIDEEGEAIELPLTDGPYIDQIFFSQGYYRPRNHALRLKNLIFFLNWLQRQSISFEFYKLPDLSRLMLKGKHEILLFYEYELSVSCLHGNESKNLFCINLYNWNGGRCTEEAHNYADQYKMKCFSQNDFFIFAHKNIK